MYAKRAGEVRCGYLVVHRLWTLYLSRMRNKQVNLSCHSMEPFEIVRCDPVTLEMKLWSTVEPTLCS